MRVVEPANFKRRRIKLHAKVTAVWLIFALLIGLGGYSLWQLSQPSSSPKRRNDKPTVKAESTTVPTPKPPKTFTGEQFKQLYHSITYPNTQPLVGTNEITGNSLADQRIRQLAQQAGYRPTSYPINPILKIPGMESPDNQLQPQALSAWLDLKAMAEQELIPIKIISAFRTIDYQRQLFLSRLLSPTVTPETIAAGQSDQAVEVTLHLTAVPGYSRHHTGYTVDFGCDDGSSTFAKSICFSWLNANNYLNAKERGWIPSYPPGANEQGPEPEPWEYVWVGRDKLV
ncbi:MAG TPA: D-alanyl-D-alanine carboxypeptidase family protein [Candidatus Saccharimonadales bacterium]|nr:D-alanyl-D-alanine carboxypeptidase family protein [Candidatus Saccharimonadales bacterium]